MYYELICIWNRLTYVGSVLLFDEFNWMQSVMTEKIECKLSTVILITMEDKLDYFLNGLKGLATIV